MKAKGGGELPVPRLEMMQEVQKVYRTNYIIYYQQLEHCLFWVIVTLKPNMIKVVNTAYLNITKQKMQRGKITLKNH